MTSFSVIGLIGHLHNERATYSLKRLISFLQKRNVEFMGTLQSCVLNSVTAANRAREFLTFFC